MPSASPDFEPDLPRSLTAIAIWTIALAALFVGAAALLGGISWAGSCSASVLVGADGDGLCEFLVGSGTEKALAVGIVLIGLAGVVAARLQKLWPVVVTFYGCAIGFVVLVIAL